MISMVKKILLSKIKETVIDLVVEKLLEQIIAKAAFMSWGPLPAITSFFLKKILVKAVDAGLLELAVGMMRHEVNQQVNKINDIARQIERTSDEAKQKELDDKLRDAYRDLIKFD